MTPRDKSNEAHSMIRHYKQSGRSWNEYPSPWKPWVSHSLRQNRK